MPPARPNVLLILADQHNAKVLGHAGHPDAKTPHLDRMAREGVRFENAVAQNPICTPSRVSWLSGQYCHNHACYGLNGPKPHGLPTVLGHFRRAGYRTAAIGKIHCPDSWVEGDSDLFFETGFSSVGGRCKEYRDYLEERGLTHLEDHKALGEFGDKGVQSVDGRPSKVSYEDGQEGWAARKAMEVMGQAARDGVPIFLHVSLPKPHQCHTPAQRFWDLYDEAKLTLPPNADSDLSRKAPHLRRSVESWRTRPWPLFEPRTFEAGRLRKLHGYLGCVSHVDHAVGEMLAWLEKSGLAENTIVIYSSDHGEYACEHGSMEKAPGICSDAVTRIPMIWRCPGRFKAGHAARELVEAVDASRTLCSLAGLEPMETADGKDLSHLLRGEAGEVRKVAVTEFPWSKSVRKGRHRLVYYPREMFAEDYPAGFGELYDLESDPWETRNLWFDPAHAGTVREMERDLLEWLVTTTRPATIQPPIKETSAQSTLQFNNAVNADGKVHPDRVRGLSRNLRQNYL
jgi:choline-sulfatase/uncharacterized sulfatase